MSRLGSGTVSNGGVISFSRTRSQSAWVISGRRHSRADQGHDQPP